MATNDPSPVPRAPGADWNPDRVRRYVSTMGPLIRAYHRAEVHGLDAFPDGAALVVANHSGGMLAMDLPVFANAFYRRFGYRRPLFTLSFDLLFASPLGDVFRSFGFIPANPGNAAAALRDGGVVVVFPGGDYDVYRPFTARNTIDFDGRTGYVRTALDAGVPIVPVVQIGGQETQLFLSRGTALARMLGLHRLVRARILPISVGFPFGLSVVLPINAPLPSKIVMQALEPIDLIETFGPDPDIDEVDTHVRAVMQAALDRLAAQRRLPVIG